MKQAEIKPREAAPVARVRRVLFVISCFEGLSTGNGGHYYSMRHMIGSLGLGYQVLVIGNFFPAALKDLPRVLYVECRYNSLRGPNFDSVEGLEKPDIIHAYDLSSACFSAILSWKWKVPLAYTKPGGPPYSKATPFFDNTILFHQKDLDNVRARPFPPKRVALISNRVDLAESMQISAPDPFVDMPPAAIRIMTIGRISTVYEEKIRQAIRLREVLAERLGSATLCIIGRVEHEACLRRLETKVGASDQIRFVTDPEATVQAARYLPFCDVVVGSGRGLMEGMGYGKIVFFATKGAELPCFTQSLSYAAAFADNFSPRVVATDVIRPAEALEEFLAVWGSDARRAAHLDWTKATFNDDHDIRTGAEKTLTFYNSLSGHESWMSARAAPFRIWLNGVIKHGMRRLGLGR